MVKVQLEIGTLFLEGFILQLQNIIQNLKKELSYTRRGGQETIQWENKKTMCCFHRVYFSGEEDK